MSDASEIRKIFKGYGLAPKKWLGQNLLVDFHYLNKIVHAAKIISGEAVVEVGAGLGILTEALVKRGAKVCALEVDSGFFRVLEEKFAHSPDAELIHADALKYDFRALAGRIGKLRVVANLPYNISSRLLFMFQENREIFTSLYILLQKEVAERLIAEPGAKEYGVLTVLLGISAKVELVFDIPPHAFFPVPEVTSTLVKVLFPDVPPFRVTDRGLLARLVKASFAERRKTLKNALRNTPTLGLSSQTLALAARNAGIHLGRRGETLSPEEFARFANAIKVEEKIESE